MKRSVGYRGRDGWRGRGRCWTGRCLGWEPRVPSLVRRCGRRRSWGCWRSKGSARPLWVQHSRYQRHSLTACRGRRPSVHRLLVGSIRRPGLVPERRPAQRRLPGSQATPRPTKSCGRIRCRRAIRLVRRRSMRARRSRRRPSAVASSNSSSADRGSSPGRPTCVGTGIDRSHLLIRHPRRRPIDPGRSLLCPRCHGPETARGPPADRPTSAMH
jgi:hypothetical protein